jgi:hypothetical protein
MHSDELAAKWQQQMAMVSSRGPHGDQPVAKWQMAGSRGAKPDSGICVANQPGPAQYLKETKKPVVGTHAVISQQQIAK